MHETSHSASIEPWPWRQLGPPGSREYSVQETRPEEEGPLAATGLVYAGIESADMSEVEWNFFHFFFHHSIRRDATTVRSITARYEVAFPASTTVVCGRRCHPPSADVADGGPVGHIVILVHLDSVGRAIFVTLVCHSVVGPELTFVVDEAMTAVSRRPPLSRGRVTTTSQGIGTAH